MILNSATGFASNVTNLDLGFLTDTVYLGNTLWQYLLFAIVIVVSFVIGKTVYFILKHQLTTLTAKTNTNFDDLLIRVLQGPLVLAIVIIGLQFGLDILTIPIDISSFLDNVLSILVSLTIIWFIIRLVDVFIEEYMKPYAEKTDTKLDEELIPVVKKVINALILIFGAITIISNFGYDLTALIAGLGIGGIALAFAAQETLSNMFGGVVIFTDRPFAIGDRVKIDDKIYGDVLDVGMRSSKIKNLDDNIVVVPNSVISKAIIENYVRPTKRIRQTFKIGLTYRTKPAKVKEAIEIIKKAIRVGDGVTKDEPDVQFTEFADSSLNLYCVYWIKSLDYWGSSKNSINMKILEDFEKAGIEMAYPTQTVHLAK